MEYFYEELQDFIDPVFTASLSFFDAEESSSVVVFKNPDFYKNQKKTNKKKKKKKQKKNKNKQPVSTPPPSIPLIITTDAQIVTWSGSAQEQGKRLIKIFGTAAEPSGLRIFEAFLHKPEYFQKVSSNLKEKVGDQS
ncbi:hypothetical protein RCL_jg17196.t1 [Rhizophagus clarus]|uniref:Uncharacterized protein n=1 Tax=Rhizophagus clarus TaxID=94130 RepID=A0A8H3LJ20_9GLOM|nr:hypothetical protein RCL_jg17196.t1 [Rhizophagus clarus]